MIAEQRKLVFSFFHHHHWLRWPPPGMHVAGVLVIQACTVMGWQTHIYVLVEDLKQQCQFGCLRIIRYTHRSALMLVGFYIGSRLYHLHLPFVTSFALCHEHVMTAGPKTTIDFCGQH